MRNKIPFGKRIKEIRLDKSLGLRQSASALGISPSYLSRLETGGEPHAPSEELIWRMSKLYEVKPYLLFAAAEKIPQMTIRFICKNEDSLRDLILLSANEVLKDYNE